MSTSAFETGAFEVDTTSIWTFSTERLPSGQPLKGLLIHRELLTKELEQLFGGLISVKLLQRLEAQQGDHIRRVIIKCGVAPMVYAETLMPAKTISRHPWLIDLGDKPLGAAMGKYGSMSRGEYQYSCLARSDGIYERAVAHADPESGDCTDLWARRYSLSLGSCDVQITEVFLPAVFCLPQHNPQIR